jgi:hypothetical protein
MGRFTYSEGLFYTGKGFLSAGEVFLSTEPPLGSDSGEQEGYRL